MNDTPRTDEQLEDGEMFVPYGFAQKLERELATARAASAEYIARTDPLLAGKEKLMDDLAAAREALRGMVNQFNSHNLLPADRAVCDVARAALDAANEAKP